MRAVIFKKFGNPGVLNLVDLEKPIPKENELLIKIMATSVTAEDPKIRSFNHPLLLRLPMGLVFGFKRPKRPVLGSEFSGLVEAIGTKVTQYKIGDQLFGYTGLSFGAYAEYKCIPENGLFYYKPGNLSFEESATIPNGTLSAFVFLKKKGKIKNGDHILIYGASGSVGTAAIQLAKFFGAEVTAVCSTKNIELVRSLGTDHVIDYTQEEFSKSDQCYDILFDTVGKTSMKKCMKVLKPKGKYILTDFGILHILAMLFTSLFGGKKVIGLASNMYWEQEDLIFFKEIIEKGKFRPVIDKSFPLEEIVEAHKYVELGRKVGNVSILVHENSTELESK